MIDTCGPNLNNSRVGTVVRLPRLNNRIVVFRTRLCLDNCPAAHARMRAILEN